MQAHQPGHVFGGKYRLIRELGKGGMASVWHAEHLTLSSSVALKLIDPAIAQHPDAVQRFLREARTAAALRSPHVVQILDYGVDDKTPYIAMELLEGESLGERLARSSSLDILETARVIRHVARAIGRAHDAGIVHRDLKPENVFIVNNDEVGIVKVSVGGLDASISPSATRTGALIGTPYFMSPEQAEGVASVDFRADLWALGVIAFRCLLGRLPFRGDSVGRLILEICSHPLPVPSELGPVPEGFDAWFARACARDPRARFDSAKQAADEFDRLGGQPASFERQLSLAAVLEASADAPLPTSRTQPGPAELRSGRRGLSARVAVSLLGAALVLGGLIWLIGGGRAQSNAGPAPVEGAAAASAHPVAAELLPPPPVPEDPAALPLPLNPPAPLLAPSSPAVPPIGEATPLKASAVPKKSRRPRGPPVPREAASLSRKSGATRSERPQRERPSPAAEEGAPGPTRERAPPGVDLGI